MIPVNYQHEHAHTTPHQALDLQLQDETNSLVDLLRREAETDGYMLTQPLALKQLEGLLMPQFLLAQPSNYTPALSGQQPQVPPPAVKRAMELSEALRR